jgi:hypothetical protein
MPFQRGIDKKEMSVIESICKLHSMVNKNNQHHVGRVPSGQKREVHQEDCTSGGTFSDYHKTSESALTLQCGRDFYSRE